MYAKLIGMLMVALATGCISANDIIRLPAGSEPCEDEERMSIHIDAENGGEIQFQGEGWYAGENPREIVTAATVTMCPSPRTNRVFDVMHEGGLEVSSDEDLVFMVPIEPGNTSVTTGDRVEVTEPGTVRVVVIGIEGEMPSAEDFPPEEYWNDD